jgi:hypothetical protein
MSFRPRIAVNVCGSLRLALPLFSFRVLMQLIRSLSIVPILALPSERNVTRLEQEVSSVCAIISDPVQTGESTIDAQENAHRPVEISHGNNPKNPSLRL